MKEERFDSILVVGIGLIGGSILKSLMDINIQSPVYGYDIHKKVTEEAFSKGLIKNPTNDIEILEDNPLVLFAVPSLALNDAMGKLEREDSKLLEEFYFENGSYKSLALKNKTTPKAVESKLARVRDKLKRFVLEIVNA